MNNQSKQGKKRLLFLLSISSPQKQDRGNVIQWLGTFAPGTRKIFVPILAPYNLLPTTSLALGGPLNLYLSGTSAHLKMGITSLSSYGFRVNLIRQSIIGMSSIQNMFTNSSIYYCLIFIFYL